MEIRGMPVPFTKENLVEAALFFSTDFKSMEKIGKKILSVSNTTFTHLNAHFTENRITVAVPESRAYSSRRQTIIFFHIKENIYISARDIDSNFYQKAYLLAVYGYEKYGQMELSNILNSWDSQRSNIAEIRMRLGYIEDYHRQIVQLINAQSAYTPFNFANLIKVGKKQKVKISVVNSFIELEFGKCTVGNDIEGRIIYKNIVFGCDYDFQVKYEKFYFSNFYYDTRWSYSSRPLHPHINYEGSVCFGNRLADYTSYRKGRHYEFLIDLFKETANSYNPESPYIPVKDLAKYLRYLNRAIPFAKLESYNSNEEKSKRLFHYCRGGNTCECGEYLVNNVCNNENCIHNPEAIINCPECGTRTVWKTNLNRLACPNSFHCAHCGQTSHSDHCTNTRCSQSPDYIKYCDRCGEPLTKNPTTNRWECRNVEHCGLATGYVRGAELTTTPACRICGGTEGMVQNSLREWYCRNYLETHRPSQYNRYGDWLGGTLIAETREDLQRSLAEGIHCYHCGSPLTLVNGFWVCQDERCSEVRAQYTENGVQLIFD